MSQSLLIKGSFVKIRSSIIALSFLFVGPCVQVTVADDGTIAELALIVMELKHFPSDSAKASLLAIAENPDSDDEIKKWSEHITGDGCSVDIQFQLNKQ